MSALDLLSGDAQAFRTEVWASRVHVHRTEPADVAGLLSLADVDHLLTSSAIRTPAVRVARNGSVLAESAYTRSGSLAGKPLTGLVDPVRLLALLDEGATVVLQGLQRYHQPLADLVAELELELGHPCQANAYLTPPASQGFAVHSDSHDVFVFQTHGTKQWEVHGEDGPGDLLLTPGVVAYLPTGTPHAARAQDTLSLHVTIGVNQLTWRQLVERVVSDELSQVPDAHLPAGWLDDPALLTDGLAGHLRTLADRLAAADTTHLARARAEHFLTHRPPRIAGGLLDRDVLVEGLSAETVLRRRTGVPCRVVDEPGEEGRVRVLLGDRSLVVPGRLRAALEEVASRSALTARDLEPHLDPASALVLCRRLVREGLLRVG